MGRAYRKKEHRPNGLLLRQLSAVLHFLCILQRPGLNVTLLMLVVCKRPTPDVGTLPGRKRERVALRREYRAARTR
jgi:hypothetical protein